MNLEYANLKATAEVQNLLLQAGCSVEQVARWRMQNSSLIAPTDIKPIYQSGVNYLDQTITLPEIPVTPTQLAKIVNQSLNKPLTAQAVNKILIELGWQEQKIRPAKREGKPVQKFYALTEVGKQHGIVQTSIINEGTKTVFQLKWFPSTTSQSIIHYCNQQKLFVA